MTKASDVINFTNEKILTILEDLKLELVDVEFVKEGSNWYLRIYIDKYDGVTLQDCENVSKKFGKILDQEDPIEQSYYLEVSSPGIDRPLKKESDFIKYKGKDVEIKLYKPIEGKKLYEGQLIGLINNNIVIKSNDQEISFSKQEVALVKLAVRF